MVFRKRFVKNYFTIGAISRSSKFLYNKMIHNIDFSKDLNIVEFGPGDGVFTDELLKQATENTKITIFEIDDGFFKLLKEKYKNEHRVILYKESAINIKKYFKKDEVDYIISSLPLAFINKTIVIEILEISKYVLKNEGLFIQYQYFLQNKQQIKKIFPKIKYKFTLLNFPPAFIYICSK